MLMYMFIPKTESRETCGFLLGCARVTCIIRGAGNGTTACVAVHYIYYLPFILG